MAGNSPGSGKTYISRLICRLTGLPLYHLDRVFWTKDWKSVTEEEFLRLQDEIIHQESWILEGGYINSLRHRAIHADMIMLLKLGNGRASGVSLDVALKITVYVRTCRKGVTIELTLVF